MKRCIPSAALARTQELVESEHLRARGFWDAHSDGLLPGLPWQASFGHQSGLAPGLGEHTNIVLSDILGMHQAEINALKGDGVLG